MVDYSDNTGGPERVGQSPVTPEDTSHGGGQNPYFRQGRQRQRIKEQHKSPVSLELSEEARKLLQRKKEKDDCENMEGKGEDKPEKDNLGIDIYTGEEENEEDKND